MNILPKKSWHVRNKDNIERVRRDEAEAAEGEKEKQRRIALAESEARTEALRLAARKRRRESAEDAESKQLAVPPSGHINFFQEEEDGKVTSGTNFEYEAEKKAEKEKQEKAIGLLTYLGQSAIEAQNEKPWYHKPPNKRQKTADSESTETKPREEFGLKQKLNLDPMKQMMNFLSVKQKVVEREKKSQPSKKTIPPDVIAPAKLNTDKLITSSESTQMYKSTAHSKKAKHKKKKEEKDLKKQKKKDKKHKHKKKKSKRYSSNSEGHNSSTYQAVVDIHPPSGGLTMQQLRAERLKREREEQVKTEQLLAKLRGDAPKDEPRESMNERDKKYNSRFNPDFVKPKKRKHFDLDSL